MSFSIFNKTWFQALCIALAVVVVYAVSLNAPFVWDDEVMIEKNLLIRSWDNVGSIFTSSAFGGSFSATEFYRPFQILSYMFDYALYGLNPAGFRATSILLHIVSCLLFFLILRHLISNKTWSFIIGILFAIHPIHIESVTYLSGRGDTLYLLFLMVSFLGFLKRDDSKFGVAWASLSCFTFLMSIFTKENGFTFPLALGVFYFTLRLGKARSAWITIGVQFLIALGYFVWRNPLVGEGNGALSAIAYAGIWERLFTGPYILWTYLRLLVAPFPLHMEYHHVVSSPLSWWTLGCTVLAGLMWKYWTVELQHRRFWFALGWFLIALAPVSQIVMPLASTVREHWLTFPSMGLFVWAGLVAAERYPTLGRKGIVSIAIVGILFGSIGMARNLDWKDPMRLYLHDLKYEPNSFVLLNNVGVIAFRNGDMNMARDYFLRAINVSPHNSYGTAHNNFGAVVEREGNISLAAHHYRQSVEMSQYELGYVNLARLQLKARNSSETVPLLEAGVTRYKNNVDMLYLLASAYYLEGQYSQAEKYYKQVQQLSPGFLTTEKMLNRIKDKTR